MAQLYESMLKPKNEEPKQTNQPKKTTGGITYFEKEKYTPEQLTDINFMQQQVYANQQPEVKAPSVTKYIKPKTQPTSTTSWRKKRPSDVIYEIRRQKEYGQPDIFIDEKKNPFATGVITDREREYYGQKGIVGDQNIRDYMLQQTADYKYRNPASQFTSTMEQTGLAIGQGLSGFFEGVGDLSSAILRWGESDEAKQLQQDLVTRMKKEKDYQQVVDAILSQDSYFGNTKEDVQNNLAFKVVEGISRMAPSLLVGTATGGLGGLLTMSFSAGGSAMKEGLDKGMTYDQSLLYGIGSGALEGLVESAFGGIPGLGQGTVGNVFKKGMSGKIGKVLVDMTGEGIEEVISTFAQPLIENIVTDPTQNYVMADPEEFVESFVLGVLISGILQAPGAVIENSQLQKDIQEGKYQQELELAQDILSQQPGLSESILDPFIQSDYVKDDLQVALEGIQGKDELQTALESMQQGETEVIEETDELFRELRNISPETTVTETVIEDGSLTDRSIEVDKLNNFIEKLNDSLPEGDKVKVEIVDFPGNERGSYSKGVIKINRNTKTPYIDIVKHELTHFMKSSDLYQEYEDLILTKFDQEGILDSERERITKLYRDRYAQEGITLSEPALAELVNEEIVAEFSESLFQDEARIRDLAEKNPNLFRKIYDWIVSKVKQLTSNGSLTPQQKEYRKFIKRAEKLYKRSLYGEYALETSEETKFSLESEALEAEIAELDQQVSTLLEQKSELEQQRNSLYENFTRMPRSEVYKQALEKINQQGYNFEEYADAINEQEELFVDLMEEAIDEWDEQYPGNKEIREQTDKLAKEIQQINNEISTIRNRVGDELQPALDETNYYDYIKKSDSKQIEKNLVALHNITEDKLIKLLDLDGMPMPSIAVTKDDLAFTNFGDITLILNKSAIDPKKKANVVGDADLYTPRFPMVEEINGQKMIWKGDDPYYSDGRRKPDSRLYLPLTKQNVLKVMKKDGIEGGEGFVASSVGGLRALASTRFKSLKDIQEASTKLIDEETMSSIKRFTERKYYDVVDNVRNLVREAGLDTFSATDEIMAEVAKDPEFDLYNAIANDEFYSQQIDLDSISEQAVQEVKEFFEILADSPSQYFEAKPQRIVEFDEVNTALVPADASPELISKLESQGINVQTFEDSTDKVNKIQEIDVPEVKFALERDIEYPLEENNIGVHYGDLGKSETINRSTYTRGTGHFGSGTYFFGPNAKEVQEKGGSRSGRPKNTVDFSNYNLFRPSNSEEGYRLHEALKRINKLGFVLDDVKVNEYIENHNFDSIESVENEYNSKIEEIESEQQALEEQIEQLKENNVEYQRLEEEYEEISMKSWRLEREMFPQPDTDDIDTLMEWYNADKTSPEIERYSTQMKEIERQQEQIIDESTKVLEEQIKELEDSKKALYDARSMLYEMNEVNLLKNNGQSIVEAIQKYNQVADFRGSGDSFSTVAMKALGYEGVDVRGIQGLDNGMYGSVIYDLDPETIVEGDVQPSDIRYALEDEITPEIQEQMQLQFPDREVAPGEKISKFLETTFESDIAEGGLDQEILNEIQRGRGTYRVVGDREAINKAREDIQKVGYNNSVGELYTKFERGDRFKKSDVTRGQLLIEEAVNKGDMETARELLFDMAIVGTELGQSIQALHLIKKASPQGKAIQIQKVINRLNNSDKMQQINNKRVKQGKQPIEIELPNEMLDAIINAQNQESLDQAFNEAILYANQQVPLTFGDKTRSWRYLSMLGNPRTHIRNIVGNTAMKAVAKFRGGLAGAIEDLRNPAIRQRTLKRATKDIKDFSKTDAEFMKNAITGSEKFNYQEGRRSFDNKFLERLAQLNFGALEEMDWKFARKAYVESLATYLTANNYSKEYLESGTRESKIALNKAREFAINEAKEQTFRTYSEIASKIGQLENMNKLSKFVIGGVLPFKTTPINIAKMGVEYGPINFGKVLYKSANNMYKSESDMINDISKGLTGTGVALLGYTLASMGILNAGGSEEDREKYFQQGTGMQPYSIKIGDKTFTLDWASPVAIPLFMGAEYQQMQSGESEMTLQSFLDALSTTIDPLTEMSMLQGLNRTLSSYDENKLTGMGVNIVQNYLGQYVPTLAGQVARTLDDTRRTTYAPKDSPFTQTGERFLRKQLSKIPGISQFMEPYIDQFGREQIEDDFLTRALQNFILPGYIDEIEDSEVTNELQRLYDLTGETGVLPGKFKKDVTVNGEKIYLDAREYTEYNKDRGQTALELFEETFSLPQYQDLTDEQKVDAVKNIFDYANDKAKANFLDQEFETSNLTPGMEMIYESSIKNIQGDRDAEGDTISGSTQGKKAYEIMSMDIDDQEKNEMLSMITTSKNPENVRNLSFLETQEDYISYFGSPLSTREKIREANKIGIAPNQFITTKEELKDVEATKYTDQNGNEQSVSGDRKDKIYAYLSAKYDDQDQIDYMFTEVYNYAPYKEGELSENPYYYWINENTRKKGRDLSDNEIMKIINANLGYRK